MRRAALGTDGMDEDLLAEARAAFLKMREAGREDAYGAALEVLFGWEPDVIRPPLQPARISTLTRLCVATRSIKRSL